MDSNQVFRNSSTRYIDENIQVRLDNITNRYSEINWLTSFTSNLETILPITLTFILVDKDCTCYIPAASITRTTIGASSYASDSFAPIAVRSAYTYVTIIKGIDAVARLSTFSMNSSGIVNINRNLSGSGTWSINLTGWDDNIAVYQSQ